MVENKNKLTGIITTTLVSLLFVIQFSSPLEVVNQTVIQDSSELVNIDSLENEAPTFSTNDIIHPSPGFELHPTNFRNKFQTTSSSLLNPGSFYSIRGPPQYS